MGPSIMTNSASLVFERRPNRPQIRGRIWKDVSARSIPSEGTEIPNHVHLIEISHSVRNIQPRFLRTAPQVDGLSKARQTSERFRREPNFLCKSLLITSETHS